MANPGPATSSDVVGSTLMTSADIGTVAAAGSTLATGTAITNVTTYVTGADGTKGVTLPAGFIGQNYVIFNNGGSALKVYPNASTIAINGGTAGAAISVGANKGATLSILTSTIIGAVYA